MYPRNASSPPSIAIGAIYLLADGTQVTAGASVRVKTGTGSWAAGGGTLSCDSTSGTWEYVPTQAETNAASFMIAVYKTGCTQATITVVTTASDTAGYGGVDWGLVRQATATVALSNTSIASVSGAVGSVTGSVGSIAGVSFPSNFSLLGINSSGHVSRVTLVDTTTTNADMRGTDGAALASVWTPTVAGRIDDNISTRLASASYTAPLTSGQTAGAVWDALLSGHTVAGSFGQRLTRSDSPSAGNQIKITSSGHVAAVVHDAEPDSIPEDAFISGALSARVIAANAITAAKVASDVSDEIAATVDSVLTAAHGAGSWSAGGSGSGAYTLTITVTDGTNPLQNATVRVAEGVTTLTQTTNASGVATFSVDAATWAVAITKGGYSFTPTTLVVSGNQSQTYAMTAVVIPSPPSAATSTVAVTCYNELTTIEPGAKLYVKQTGIPAGSTDTAFDGTEKEYTANGSGLVVLTLWRNATYQIRRGTSKQATSFTPTTATYSISSIIGSP